MKKMITLIGATIGGFVGVLVLHGPTQSTTLTSASTNKTSGSAKPLTAPTASPRPKKSTVSNSTISTPSPVNGSAVGKPVNYGYGQMAVKVVVANNKITDVTVSSLTTLESYSAQLEQQVVPVLKSEVLQANGTHILLLTGATYTSEAYATSLQSALNKLHFK